MASQNTISKVEIGGTNYDLVASNGVYYIEGTGSTAGTWLGSHPDITAYYPGLMVLYKIPIAGASTTKLNINSLGAVTVVRNVTTAISTAYAEKALVLLTYTLDGTTAYWKAADYDSNTKTTTNSTDTSEKIFLVGAKTQGSSVTTFSQSEVFADAGGILNAEKLVLNTTGTPAISLKRSSNNYLQVPTGASFCVCPNNTITLANSALIASAEGIYPGTTNTFDLGKSSAKWRTVYATTFSGSGASLTNLPAGQLTGTINAARLPAATTTTQGALSAADKIKLDGLEAIISITDDEIDAICTSALEVDSTLVDEVTGTSYRLYVSEGNLKMAEVNNQ